MVRIAPAIGVLSLGAVGCGESGSTSTSAAASASGGAEPGCVAPNRTVDADGAAGCLAPGIQDNGCAAGTYALDDGSGAPAGLSPSTS